MALNQMYARGYDAGYKKGLQTGLSESVAHSIMERDLVFIYGVLAIVLTEKHHWKQDSVQNLITEIQTTWHNLTNEHPEYDSLTMFEMVEQRTGISLQQMTQEILDGGWD